MNFVPDEAQRLMINHLANHNEAMLLCGMSLGKTAATLSQICEKLFEGEIRGVLIVAPIRVINLTFPAEIEKWDEFNWLRHANLRTKEGWEHLRAGTAHIYLINYEMLPRLKRDYLVSIKKKSQCSFDMVVFDEISMAKDYKSKRINSVRNFFKKVCGIRWGLTGTPTPNSYQDIFAQVRLIDGGVAFGNSFHTFRKRYFDPIDFNEYKWEIKKGAKEEIERKLSSLAITLKTSDYVDLPDIVQHDVEIALSPTARKFYNKMETDLLIQFERSEAVSLNSAVLVSKLLQIASGALYANPEEANHENKGKVVEQIHEDKFKAAKKLISSIDDTVIVVYQFRHELDRLRKLDGAVVFSEHKGETNEKRLLDQWNSRKIKVLVVHPQSISHGLNMQFGGSNIIWCSPTYSREKYDQLNARLCRRGQEENTNVYRIVAQDTIDYPVLEVLRNKGEMQDGLFQALKRYTKTKKP